MKVKIKSKNAAYKEKQRKAAAIKAGTYTPGPTPTGKYAPDVPDYIMEDLLRQGLSREEALDWLKDQLLIRTISFDYGNDVRCQFCGRKNYPEEHNGAKLQWHVDRSLFLVNTNNFKKEPQRKTAMILCQDCLKHEIEERYHAGGNFVICNDGNLLDDASSLIVSLNLHAEKDLQLWLDKKYNLDKEYYSLSTGMEIAEWLRNLWQSHVLNCAGFNCQDRCYGIMCEMLGLPYNAEEHRISCIRPHIEFTPAAQVERTTDAKV